MHCFPVIAGPTAGGKSALGVEVAIACAALGRPGEVVSADAYLVYRGMDIGTAKPTPHERAGVPHHLIDIVNPGDAFSVHDWLARADAAIADIRARGGTPVVAGGTHLFIKALLDGLFEGPGEDPALRAQLRELPAAELRRELERIDPAAAQRLHPNDIRRTIRAIEVYRATGTPISALQRQWDVAPRDDRTLIVLDWPGEAINLRINARVRTMFDMGLVEEVRSLHERGLLRGQAGEALGYHQVVDYLEGRCTLDDAFERVKIDTRRLAKNQRTWLRRLRATPGCVAIDAASVPAGDWAGIVMEACSRR